MSLDVYLKTLSPQVASAREAIFVWRDGESVEVSRDDWNIFNPGREPVTTTININPGWKTQVYSSNITQDLDKMAIEAGIYDYLWQPEEIGVMKAEQLIKPLSTCLELLRSEPQRFRKFNPKDGWWGSYANLIKFVDSYLYACTKHPEADVSVSR